jgi:hypothetical protein
MINVTKLTNDLINAGIVTCGCNSNGVVWDDDNNDISKRPDVAMIIANHDPTPDPEPPSDKELILALQAQVAILTKTASKEGLTSEELATLGVVEEKLWQE